MALSGIVLLIVIGLMLILLEILVIPGTTVVGVGGMLMVAAGVYFAFDVYGVNIGVYTLLSVIVLTATTIYFSLKTKTWKKMMLKSQIDGKAVEEIQVKMGDRGKTVSRLAPMGKITINGSYYEAKTLGELIDENLEIEVVKTEDNQIFVKPLKIN